MQTCSLVPNFYVGSGDWNSNPWACVANTLPTPTGPFQSFAASLGFPFFESVIFSLILSCVFQPIFLSPAPLLSHLSMLPSPCFFFFSFLLKKSLAVSSGWVQIHSALASASWIEEITVCTTMSGHFSPFSSHLFLEPNCTQCSDKAPLSGPVWGATSTLLGACHPPLRSHSLL